MIHYYKQAVDYIKNKPSVGFAVFLFQRFKSFDLNKVAASLTYTTLLALVPLLTMIFIVLKALPKFDEITNRVNDFISLFLMPSGASLVREYLQEFIDKAGNLTLWGVCILAISATMLMMTIEHTFNRIWLVNKERQLLTRLLIYWTVLTLGPLCLGTFISIWAFIFKPSTFVMANPALANLFYFCSIILFLGLLFCLVYRVIPYRYVPFKHALIGGLMTAFVFEVVRHGFSFYMKSFNNYELIYGAFAVVPLFLLWLFLLWYIILSGAVLTASLSYWQGQAFKRNVHKKIHINDIVQVLVQLESAQKKGQVLKIQNFRQNINLGYDVLGDLLERLSRYGYTIRAESGWILKKHPDKIILSDLFKLFVYRPLHYKNDVVSDQINQLLGPAFENLDISLTEFIAQSYQRNKPECN